MNMKMLEASFCGRNQLLVNLDSMPDAEMFVHQDYYVIPKTEVDIYRKSAVDFLMIGLIGGISIGVLLCYFTKLF